MLQQSRVRALLDGPAPFAALRFLLVGAQSHLLREIRRVTRGRVIVMGADGTTRGLVRRVLLAADRGEWMRTPDALRSLIGEVLDVREVVRFDVGFCTELLHVCRAS
jgi:hypothetical protein